VNQKKGRRLSAARAFLKPALKRPNLRLFSNALVDRILFDGRKAAAVSIRNDGTDTAVAARREVVLSAGAVSTPVILERSGIGDEERLRVLGVPFIHHLPGVGENLQDHLQLRCVSRIEGARSM